MLLNEAIVKRIIEIKEENHLSDTEWSAKAGIAPNTLRNIIHKKTYPKLSTIKKLCSVLNMPIWVFLDVDYIKNAHCKKE